MAQQSPLLNTLTSPRHSEDEIDARRYSADVGSSIRSPASVVSVWSEGKKPRSRWRHAIGIVLLLATVFLWTTSNFLASTIFADDSYSKPYFVTYVNTAFFIIPLFPMLAKHAWDDRRNTINQQPVLAQLRDLLQRRVGRYKLIRDHESSSSNSLSSKMSHDRSSGATSLLLGDEMGRSQEIADAYADGDEGITLKETMKISLEFCLLWFLANYFAAACLEYTTVASSTILSSTSSIWTLLCGSLLRVERFTLRKFLGVCTTLAGVILISSVDVSGETDENRGNFPHKTPRELAIGDTMAFISAVLYGFYAVFMKKRIGDESKVNMPLFFGLVGTFNVALLWPGMILLHLTGIEKFALPPTKQIFTIVMVNSASSLVSDFCWAYSMLLTSPLIVTVGLSLTIPLSLVGQMVLDKQYSSPLYWVGAALMVLSFVFINHEDKKDEEDGLQDAEPVLSVRQSFQSGRSMGDSIRSGRSRGDSIRSRRDSIRSQRSATGVV
ncbi:vacuolar membrane protein [Massarina eburnea CBS 473.64]|uniref:Vacuolar membrane protein n=1 Tax=Massarina eburnea CBS 473.64 TaxID=1395130 RepID=A0A6A6SER7_9PLEO|nr:vacuolar membrane protein [Massarina eburnea CBS 473.64]